MVAVRAALLFLFQSPATLVTSTAHFELHSDPWINLHHFLYQWSREDRRLGAGRQHVAVPERASLARLPAAERSAWEESLAFYRESVAPLGHFDDPMLRQKGGLLAMAGDPRARPPDSIPGIAPALARAMPVYQSRWWPRHDAANRGWIADVAPLLRRHEGRYVELTRRIYGSEWPATPRRADVSAYANADAGYTAEGHIVIYSTDDGNQELYGLETLLHEVQHTPEVGSAARAALAAAFDSAGVKQPRNLWHALIFSTAGTFVTSVAKQEGRPEHVPYWIKEEFPSLGGWSALVPATARHWEPVVRGEDARDAGFAALVAELST